MVLTVPIAATIAGILTKYRTVELTEIHEDAPSAEELEELLQINKPNSKARSAISIAMIVVVLCTVLIITDLVTHPQQSPNSAMRVAMSFPSPSMQREGS